MVEVVAERRVRGAVEKTLRVAADAARLSSDEIRQMSAEDYRPASLIVITHLLHALGRYLQQLDFDFARDLAGYRTVSFYAAAADLE